MTFCAVVRQMPMISILHRFVISFRICFRMRLNCLTVVHNSGNAGLFYLLCMSNWRLHQTTYRSLKITERKGEEQSQTASERPLRIFTPFLNVTKEVHCILSWKQVKNIYFFLLHYRTWYVIMKQWMNIRFFKVSAVYDERWTLDSVFCMLWKLIESSRRYIMVSIFT